MRRWGCLTAVWDVPRMACCELLRQWEVNIKSETLDEIHVSDNCKRRLHDLFEAGYFTCG